LVKGTGAAEEVSQADLVIVDEVSRVSASMLEALNGVLSNFGADSAAPFGGKSVLLLGDFFQLPAIGGQAAYHSKLYLLFTQFALLEGVRQGGDQEFAQVLGKVRVGVVDDQVTAFLRGRVCGVGHERGEECDHEQAKAVVITSHCSERDAINQVILSTPGRRRRFEGRYRACGHQGAGD